MKEYQQYFDELTELTENRISELFTSKPPFSIYEPFNYVMSAGGKRIRPFLTMISAGAICGQPEKALDAAIAIETLHNFTLVHDDIMDESSFRRGKPTVHKKWDSSVAILTGDVMVGWAYKLLNSYIEHSRFTDIISTFTEGLIEVCEGQAYDMDFNTMQDVSPEDYILMIDKKTAKILQTCSMLGGLIGNCSDEQFHSLSEYAYHLGIAFQLQDDLLDISADQDKLGKKIGQDIIEGKKTLLIIKTKQLATQPDDIALIEKFYSNNGLSEEYVPKMRELFEKLGILDAISDETEKHLQIAISSLENLNDSYYKELLIWLIGKMSGRKY